MNNRLYQMVPFKSMMIKFILLIIKPVADQANSWSGIKTEWLIDV